MRKLLFPFSLLYGGLMRLRNYFYKAGWLRSFEFDFPIILVGNLNSGGTGKTPHIEYLIRLLKGKYKAATLSRGYKRKTRGYILGTELSLTEDVGDESKLFKYKHPEIEIAVSEDRVQGIYALLQDEPEVKVILMDDGFQHRRIKAGMQILLTSYGQLFSNDCILPAGHLREPRSGYKRANMLIVTKCPADMKIEEAEILKKRIAAKAHQRVFFTKYIYLPVTPLFEEQKITFATDKKNILLVTAIAGNKMMKQYLSGQFENIRPLAFPDHHYFTVPDIDRIKKENPENRIIITTEKDAMRLMEQKEEILSRDLSFFVLPVETDFLFNGKSDFDERISGYIKTYAEGD